MLPVLHSHLVPILHSLFHHLYFLLVELNMLELPVGIRDELAGLPLAGIDFSALVSDSLHHFVVIFQAIAGSHVAQGLVVLSVCMQVINIPLIAVTCFIY